MLSYRALGVYVLAGYGGYAGTRVVPHCQSSGHNSPIPGRAVVQRGWEGYTIETIDNRARCVFL